MLPIRLEADLDGLVHGRLGVLEDARKKPWPLAALVLVLVFY